ALRHRVATADLGARAGGGGRAKAELDDHGGECRARDQHRASGEVAAGDDSQRSLQPRRPNQGSEQRERKVSGAEHDPEENGSGSEHRGAEQSVEAEEGYENRVRRPARGASPRVPRGVDQAEARAEPQRGGPGGTAMAATATPHTHNAPSCTARRPATDSPSGRSASAGAGTARAPSSVGAAPSRRRSSSVASGRESGSGSRHASMQWVRRGGR